MSESEIGTCDICKKRIVNITRKYYHYDVKCECHRDHHFEIVRHCKDCTPVEPKETRVLFKTKALDEGAFR